MAETGKGLPRSLPGLYERVKKLEDGGGGSGGPVAWGDITGKPTTFPPVVGTTATTAKAGNYVPAWGEITAKPATFAPPAATATIVGGVKQGAAIANVTGETPTSAEFNALLVSLRAAGILAS